MKSIRNRGKRDVLHPIFLECKAICNNEYWKNVFDDLAYGKYPKQIYISNQTIQSSNRKKPFSFIMKDKPAKEVMENTISILTCFTDLISSEEIKKKKDGNDLHKRDNWNYWKDIKRKYIKDILLMNYCLELKKDYGLSTKSTSCLYQGLIYRIYSGQITDIVMKDRKIESIPALTIDPDTKKISYEEEFEAKNEQMYEMEDYIHHYNRRYLMKLHKFKMDRT